ncbi:MAG: hypothetical protein RLZZ70_282 [Candidatus Parcubacteria bacterium]
MGGDAHGPSKEDKEKMNDKTETASTTEEATTNSDDTAPVTTLPTGTEGKVTVANKKAGRSIAITDTVYPIEEGWIGVREYNDGKLGWILGVIRFSAAGNVVPTAVPLQYATTPGKEYAVVMFTEGGQAGFNSATDRQLDTIYTTFKAE